MKFLRIEQLIFEYSKEILNQIIFNVILIAQSDKMLDKQIRSLIEYDVKHIKMNNGFFFFLPTSLYYRVVVIRAPLQGLCYNVRDAVDWFSRPTARRFQKGSNHSPLQYC